MVVANKRYFDDLVVGERRTSGCRSLTLEEIVDFARRYDPQYFHMDVEAARHSAFGEVIASGVQSVALWRSLDHEISGDIAWICGVAWEEVRWPAPLRAGDEVRAESECLQKRLSRTDPSRGVVEYRYSLLNQRNELNFTCRSINLIEMGPRES